MSGVVVLPARDPVASTCFLAGVLGSRATVAIRYELAPGPVDPTCCTVLVDEDEFDAAYGRLMDHRVRVWADRDRRRPAEINHRNGGRALCFADPEGHTIELATTPATPTTSTGGQR